MRKEHRRNATKFNLEKTGNFFINVTLRHVNVKIVVVGKQ
jgi:hypothetical protein